jgi:hypothetical protein
MRIKKSLILEGGYGLRNGGEDEVAVFFAVLGKTDSGGGPMATATEGTGDGVYVDPAFRA